MKSKILSLFLSIMLISTPSLAGFYAGLGLGSAFNDGSVLKNHTRSSLKNSPVYSLSAGYQLPLLLTDVRVEGEYLRIHPDKKYGGHASMDAFMVNGYANLPILPIINPYIGLGLGMSRFEHENSPAYQGMLGLEYELPFMPVTIGGEYRYFKVSEDGGARGETAKMHSNILMLKLRYDF